MPTLVPVDHDPFATGPLTPVQSAQQAVPGTVAGNINAQPDVVTSMIPLSDDAERAKSILLMQTMAGNRGGVAGAQDLLNSDPTYQAQKAQSTALGADAARRSEAKRTGLNIIKSYAQLQHSFDETPDDKLLGAIGPFNTNKIGPAGWGVGSLIRPANIDNMTPPEAAAAHPYNPYTASWAPGTGNADAWDTQNLFNHDVHGLTNAFMSGAGKAVNVSDSRQEMFNSTMADFMKGTSRDSAAEVLAHAKNIIINDFGLTPEEADDAVKKEIQTIRLQKARSMAIKAVPADALKFAGDHSDDPLVQKHFQDKYHVRLSDALGQ